VLCWTKHHAMKTYWGIGGVAPRILDLGTRCRWVVSFTPRPLHPQGKSPLYPLHRRLGGPQSRSGQGGEEKNPSPRQESNSRIPIVQPVTQRYTDWAITALLLCTIVGNSCESVGLRFFNKCMKAAMNISRPSFLLHGLSIKMNVFFLLVIPIIRLPICCVSNRFHLSVTNLSVCVHLLKWCDRRGGNFYFGLQPGRNLNAHRWYRTSAVKSLRSELYYCRYMSRNAIILRFNRV
jgi:hypothetical protein